MFDDLILDGATRHNLDPKLVTAVMMHESSGKVDAIGDNGQARGLFQMHQGAVIDAGGSYQDWLGFTTDPANAIEFGCRYLARMLKVFKGDIPWALAAWNRGITVISLGKAYADAVQALM